MSIISILKISLKNLTSLFYVFYAPCFLLHAKITQAINATRATSVCNKIALHSIFNLPLATSIYFLPIKFKEVSSKKKKYFRRKLCHEKNISEVNCAIKTSEAFRVERATATRRRDRFGSMKQAFSISLIPALKVPCAIISTVHDSGVT